MTCPGSLLVPSCQKLECETVSLGLFVQIIDFPDKISFYTMGCVGFFKSVWKAIRANAAMFVGKNVTTRASAMCLYTVLSDLFAVCIR